MEIKIRKATKNDIYSINKLVIYLMKVEKVDNVKKQASLIMKQRIKPTLDKGNISNVFVAEAKKQVIGFILVEIRLGVASIAYFAINPSSQKIGIGKKLVGKAAKYARSKKTKILQVLVHKNNKISAKFHKRMGFELFGYNFRRELK